MMHEFYDKVGLKIDERSFRDCYVDLGKVGVGSVLQQYPQLAEWVEMKDDPKKYKPILNNNSVLKYIVCMYDSKSPFRGLEYDQRKVASAIYADFDVAVGGDFTPKYQEVMNGLVEIVNMMAIRYCIITKGLEYSTYKEFERRYYEISLKDPNRKITDIDKEREVVARYRDTFLESDTSKGIQQTLYKIVTEEEKKLRKLRPEYQQEFFYNRIAETRDSINKAYADED